MAEPRRGRSLAERIGTWPVWTARLVLCGWWLLIFAATHVPIPSQEGPSPVPDKLVHFVMYFGLGLLLPLWCGWTTPTTLRRGLRLMGIISLYAVVDELLQIPVGRTAEWLDWAADLAGGATGLVLHAVASNWLFASPAPATTPSTVTTDT